MRDFWRNVSWGWLLMGFAIGALSIVGLLNRLLELNLIGLPNIVFQQYCNIVEQIFGELTRLFNIRIEEPWRHVIVFWAVTSSNTARFFHLYKHSLDQTFRNEVVYFDETPGGYSEYGLPMKYPVYMRLRLLAIILGPFLYVLVLFDAFKAGSDRVVSVRRGTQYYEKYEVGPEFVRHVAILTRRLWYMLFAAVFGGVLFLVWNELSRVSG
jgi:hypothetical protein